MFLQTERDEMSGAAHAINCDLIAATIQMHDWADFVGNGVHFAMRLVMGQDARLDREVEVLHHRVRTVLLHPNEFVF